MKGVSPRSGSIAARDHATARPTATGTSQIQRRWGARVASSGGLSGTVAL